MRLKPLKFRRKVSIPSAIALTWLFPSLAAANSEALPEAAAPDIPQATNSHQNTSVSVLPTPSPPETLPPQLSAQIPQTPFQVQTVPATDNNRLSQLPANAQIPPTPFPVQTVPATDNNTLSQPPTPETAQINVQTIQVTGNTILSQSELSSIIKPVEGRKVSFQELTNLADAITQLYLNRGYITSRALLVPQTVANGIVEVRVLEGSLEAIEVEGTRRLNPNYVRSRLKLGASTPLNTNKLEDQLKLLRADPLFSNVEASLKPGSGDGKSIVVVRVVEANPITGGVSIDNYSPPSVGSERLGVNISDRNLTGNGDQLAASYYRTTTGGANQLDLSYRVPVNAMNGTVQFRAAPSWTRVTQAPFNAFNITGSSQLYELTYRQPLVRTPREEFALSLGFAYQDGQTFTFAGPTPFGLGPDENGISRTSVVKFGQDYLRRDSKGAWGLRSQFSLGTGLFNATSNPSPIPDGHFFSWLGQVQRVQTLSPNNLLIVQGDIQLTPNSLLPSQQFVIGGGQSLRGYRQNVRAGDNGVRFSIEDRISLQRNQAGESVLQLAPFFDAGTVWNVANNPNTLPRQTFLAGVGMGVIWQPLPKLNMRLDYGLPLVNLDDRGNNAQDQGLYFSVGYQF